MKSNIVLVGFMGTGKTTIGKELSKELDMKFIDTDELIEKKANMKIKDIFAKYGEKHFRDIETEIAKSTNEMENCIISTGGGIVLREENIKYLQEKGRVFLLWAEPETIHLRTKDKKTRPLLLVENPLEKIKELLAKRVEAYNKNYDYKIITDSKAVEDIVTEIKANYIRS